MKIHLRIAASLPAIAIVLVGCGKKSAPDPELLGQQLTIEAVDAVAAGDRDLAVGKTSRLLTMSESTPGTDELLRLVIDNAALESVASEATPTAALRNLDAVRSEHGSSGRLDDAAHELMDLELVARYAGTEWTRPGPMALAFGDLPVADRWPDSGYAEWHAAEAKKLAEMQELERKRLVGNLLKTLDRSEIAGDGEGADAVLAQLKRLAPNHAVVGGKEGEGQRVADELSAWRTLRDGGSLNERLREPVETLSGKGALALQAVRNGDRVTALALWRELKSEFPPTDDRLLLGAITKNDAKRRLAAVPNLSGTLGVLAVLAGGTTDFEDEKPNKGE